MFPKPLTVSELKLKINQKKNRFSGKFEGKTPLSHLFVFISQCHILNDR